MDDKKGRLETRIEDLETICVELQERIRDLEKHVVEVIVEKETARVLNSR